MRNLLTVAALTVATFIVSCSGAEAGATGDNAEKTAKTELVAPGKMNDLMAMLDGTEGCAQKAVDAFFSDSLKNSLEESNSLTFANYNMQEAKVVAVEGQCCTMEAKAGVTTRTFKLCWEGDKVTAVEDLGMK